MYRESSYCTVGRRWASCYRTGMYASSLFVGEGWLAYQKRKSLGVPSRLTSQRFLVILLHDERGHSQIECIRNTYDVTRAAATRYHDSSQSKGHPTLSRQLPNPNPTYTRIRD